MTKKQPGETFQYENILYSIGGWIQCTEGSDYAGLSGVIMEIREERIGKPTTQRRTFTAVCKCQKTPNSCKGLKQDFPIYMGKR